MEMNKVTKVNTDVVQWAVRSAYEEGYRAACGERGVSRFNPDKGQWFDHWITSKTRAMLIENGVISGEEGYK